MFVHLHHDDLELEFTWNAVCPTGSVSRGLRGVVKEQFGQTPARHHLPGAVGLPLATPIKLHKRQKSSRARSSFSFALLWLFGGVDK